MTSLRSKCKGQDCKCLYATKHRKKQEEKRMKKYEVIAVVILTVCILGMIALSYVNASIFEPCIWPKC